MLVYRCGMRRNNADALLASRRIFSPIWFARNHSIIDQLIHFSDMLDRLHYPDLVRNTWRTQILGNFLLFILLNINLWQTTAAVKGLSKLHNYILFKVFNFSQMTDKSKN